MRRGGTARKLLHRIDPVVQERGRGPDHRLAGASSKSIILKSPNRGPARDSGDRGQLVPRIPTVVIDSIARQVAIQVVSQVRRGPLRELIVRIINGRSQRLRQTRARHAAADRYAPTVAIVSISQTTQVGRAQAISTQQGNSAYRSPVYRGLRRQSLIIYELQRRRKRHE